MLWFAYNLIFPVVLLLLLPRFLLRMVRRGGYRRHFEQRIGFYGKGTASRLASAPRIWVHAVSVGELFVALRFMDEYRRIAPDALFVLSTNTSTGHRLAAEKMDPRDVLIYFPVDLPCVMRRALDCIRPRKIILVECEFWPNLIRLAHRRGIPVALINGRISRSSFRGYRLLRPFVRRMLEWIDPVCMQGETDTERILALGARKESVKTLGTAKYDIPPPSVDAGTSARCVLRELSVPEGALILLGGSTWTGEEELLCRIYKELKPVYPDLFLVLVPRHAERRAQVAEALSACGLSFALRSAMEASASAPDVLVVDTTGELMDFYAVADLVVVGKSLCHQGGQNPIEPALFGKAIITGPNMENFPLVMDDFLRKNAVWQVAGTSELRQAVADLLASPAERLRLGQAAKAVVEHRRGAVARMVKAIGS